MLGARYSSQILMEIELSGQIFEEYTNIKFHENPSGGSRVFPCGWTDGYDELNNRFSKICECA
jgi:hypothetical protein